MSQNNVRQTFIKHSNINIHNVENYPQLKYVEINKAEKREFSNRGTYAFLLLLLLFFCSYPSINYIPILSIYHEIA